MRTLNPRLSLRRVIALLILFGCLSLLTSSWTPLGVAAQDNPVSGAADSVSGEAQATPDAAAEAPTGQGEAAAEATGQGKAAAEADEELPGTGGKTVNPKGMSTRLAKLLVQLLRMLNEEIVKAHAPVLT